MLNLPKYKITEEIYENNQLIIYRGHTVREQSPVIIKALQVEASPINISKLIDEFEIIQSLDIEGIIKPIRQERVGSTIALIMEDNGAIPIGKYLLISRSDLTDFFSIAVQLTEILMELHHKGIIHRDLKPDNILIHPGTGQVNLIITSPILYRQSQDELNPIGLTESPAYMSPEQIAG